MGMDILVEDTTSQNSETTMIGRTITATDITIRSAVTAALATQAALAAGMKEALVVVGMASAVEDSVVAMVAVAVMEVAAAIADRSNHA
jgi:hypothetical protein